MDKTLVRMEESARAVILMDSVNKVFRKTGQNSQKIPHKKYLCWSLFLSLKLLKIC